MSDKKITIFRCGFLPLKNLKWCSRIVYSAMCNCKETRFRVRILMDKNHTFLFPNRKVRYLEVSTVVDHLEECVGALNDRLRQVDSVRHVGYGSSINQKL